MPFFVLQKDLKKRWFFFGWMLSTSPTLDTKSGDSLEFLLFLKETGPLFFCPNGMVKNVLKKT
jgi:hypothetical protein